MDKVFFTNSGAEAVEGAIKAARKYAYLKDGAADHEIIAMEHSFHGRTMGVNTPRPPGPIPPDICCMYEEGLFPLLLYILSSSLSAFPPIIVHYTIFSNDILS